MKRLFITFLGILAWASVPVGIVSAQSAQELRDLCVKYYYGQGVSVNYAKSLQYAIQAGNKGNAECQMIAGNMCMKGLGTEKNYVKAAEWFKEAASQKYNGAETNLGWVLLYGGNGLKKNERLALSCFERAGNRGEVVSMWYAGYCYEKGLGTSVNLTKAKEWFAKGAATGNKDCVERLKALGGKTSVPPTTKTTTTTTTTTKSKAQLTWLSTKTTTTDRKFALEAGIKSSSKVEDVVVKLNGQTDRGIKTVNDDGYDMLVSRTLTLAQGVNTIRVEVTNAGGTAAFERKVTYAPANTEQITKKTTDEVTKKTNTITNKINTKEKRVALVLGNSNYQDSNMKLANPVNDAADLASRLVQLGFVVVRSLNQTRQGIENAIQTFGTKAEGCDVALFFYAGHGIQYQGDNYMVPIDAKLPSEEYVKYNCTNANLVLDVMERAGCKMKIVILDACRNNPFARSWHRSTGGGGLGIMNAPKGTFIAFSTAPGDVASDGKPGNRNSPYTSALLKTLDKKGLSITDFFQEVLERVASSTDEKQTPWTSNSFRGNFVFNPK